MWQIGPSFNVNYTELHEFFHEQNQMFDLIGGCIAGRMQPCDVCNHSLLAKTYVAEEIDDGHQALLHGATVVPADKQSCINRTMRAWRSLGHEEIRRHFLILVLRIVCLATRTI